MQILDGRTSFYQWDINQKITSTEFRVGDEVHFHNIRQSEALVVMAYELNGKVVADVPNILLQTSYPIHVYKYLVDGASGQTVYEHTFNVTQRAKPNDYVYTETEILTITAAVNQAIDEAKANGDFKGEKGDKGDKGDKGERGEQGIQGIQGVKGADGTNGEDGYTPKKGVDYYTEAEKQSLVTEIETTVLGDIDTALDNIIAIQNTLIGGDSE